MFLDTGGQYFYHGQYASFVENLSKNPNSLEDQFKDIFGNLLGPVLYQLTGWIIDGLAGLWNILKSIGNFIWKALTDIVGWIISVVKDIVNKVGHIVQGMLYGVPAFVLLFAVTYFGDMLYSGHIPKLGKERRLLKRMRPKAIRRKAKMIRRKLKYPIIQAEHVRSSAKKGISNIRDWRVERSKKKGEMYGTRTSYWESKQRQYEARRKKYE